ncbi:MAG: hypothetical protein ACK559_10220, partial [bacterium]
AQPARRRAGTRAAGDRPRSAHPALPLVHDLDLVGRQALEVLADRQAGDREGLDGAAARVVVAVEVHRRVPDGVPRVDRGDAVAVEAPDQPVLVAGGPGEVGAEANTQDKLPGIHPPRIAEGGQQAAHRVAVQAQALVPVEPGRELRRDGVPGDVLPLVLAVRRDVRVVDHPGVGVELAAQRGHQRGAVGGALDGGGGG